MRLQKFSLPGEIEACCVRLREAGWPAYPVGGCVRDLLLGRVPGDYDLTTAARPDQVMELFPRTVPTGLRHGTVTVLTGAGPVEVTSYRCESGYADGRHPDCVQFDATLEEDLGRRDFTINAMALESDGSVIDLHGGLTDLKRRVIRCVGEPERRFSEDALRMLRAGRFAAQLGFVLEGRTETALRTCAHLIAQVSAERVRVELEKTLCSPGTSWAEFLFATGLLARYTSCVPGSLTGLAHLPGEPLARWAGLCAALDQNPQPFLEGLRLERKLVHACTEGYMLWKDGLPHCPAQWRRVLANNGQLSVRAAAWMGDWAGELASPALEAVLADGGCWTVKDLALSGADLMQLGYRGTAIGAAQRHLLDHVLEYPERNTRDSLKAELKQWPGCGGERK